MMAVPHCVALPMSGRASLANRFSFSKASRFIRNFIREYFLKRNLLDAAVA
jgi:hypothetical protein